MNIGEAKEELRRTAEIYLDTNEYGEYTIPYERQRPVLIVGAPGIGKTAVAGQIAAEMDIALVSCSPAHYTKQGALGLPYMAKREYGGKAWQISQYTMSEILLAVYETMEESGRRRGILFLDEIHRVPEAMVPVMHSFLQNKRLGGKSLPEGWVIAAAGNPMGDGIGQLDITMLDQLKFLEVEADLGAWKAYAYPQAVHAAVTAFLALCPESFYSLHAAGEDREYVTARGWEDLSGALRMYEKKGFQVDEKLIGQYVGCKKTRRRFRECYEVFLKCRERFSAADILGGNWSSTLAGRAAEAEPEERTVLSHMLLEGLNRLFSETAGREAVRRRVGRLLGNALPGSGEEGQLPPYGHLYIFQEQLKEERRRRQAANSLSPSLKAEYTEAERLTAAYLEAARREGDIHGQIMLFKREMENLERESGKQAERAVAALKEGMSFMEEVWGRGHELDTFRRELAANPFSSRFSSPAALPMSL